MTKIFALLVAALTAFSLSSCRIDNAIDLDKASDNTILDLLETDIHNALANMGVPLTDLFQSLENETQTLQACPLGPYLTQDTILQRRQLLGNDPGLNKRFCHKKNTILGFFCDVLESLAEDSPSLIRLRLENDLPYWRAVSWLNFIYLMNHRVNPGSDKLTTPIMTNFMVLYRASQVDGIISSGRKIETLFIGDSLIHFAEAGIPHDEFKNSAFLGIIGERTDGLYYRIFDNVKKLNPENVVLSIGGNDFQQGCYPDSFNDNRKKIIFELKKMGVKNVYLLSFPPLLDQKKNGKIYEANLRTAAVAAQTGAKYVDIYSGLSNYGIPKAEYFLDGTHFNPDGYKEVVVPRLHELGLY